MGCVSSTNQTPEVNFRTIDVPTTGPAGSDRTHKLWRVKSPLDGKTKTADHIAATATSRTTCDTTQKLDSDRRMSITLEFTPIASPMSTPQLNNSQRQLSTPSLNNSLRQLNNSLSERDGPWPGHDREAALAKLQDHDATPVMMNRRLVSSPPLGSRQSAPSPPFGPVRVASTAEKVEVPLSQLAAHPAGDYESRQEAHERIKHHDATPILSVRRVTVPPETHHATPPVHSSRLLSLQATPPVHSSRLLSLQDNCSLQDNFSLATPCPANRADTPLTGTRHLTSPPDLLPSPPLRYQDFSFGNDFHIPDTIATTKSLDPMDANVTLERQQERQKALLRLASGF